MATIEAGAEIEAGTEPGTGRESVVPAIAMVCGAVFLYSIMDAIIKYLGGRGYTIVQLLFVRCFIGMVPVSIMVVRAGGRHAVRSARPLLLFVRAALGLGSLYAFFVAFQMIPLAEAVALGFAAPLIVTALSAPLLGERVGLHRWGAVLVGFAGVLVIARPGPALLANPGVLVALAGALLYAFSIVLNRKYLSESNLSVVFYTTFYGLLISSALLPLGFVVPRGTLDVGMMVMLGLVSTLGLLLLTRAYRSAPAAVLAPFDYTGIVYATALGFFFFGERLSFQLTAGVALIVASALYVVHRETRAGSGQDI